jgi:hypothetical protein
MPIGTPYFLYMVIHVLKVVEELRFIDREPLIFCTR